MEQEPTSQPGTGTPPGVDPAVAAANLSTPPPTVVMAPEPRLAFENIPGVYTEITKPETPAQETYVEAVFKAQLRLAAVRHKLNPFGSDPNLDYASDPEYIEALMVNSEYLAGVLLLDRSPVKPENIPLSRDGYELLAFRLNKGNIPTYDEIVGLRNVITARNPESLLADTGLTPAEKAKLEGYIKDVQEKTRAEHWMLSDEESDWYDRVAKAPSLTPYVASPPKKSRVPRFISGPKHVDPKYKPKAPRESLKYLSKDEIAKVKKDFWYENPRQEFNPDRDSSEDNAILKAAQDEAKARLRIDNRMTKLKNQIEEEKEMEAQAQQAATYAAQLGALGVRPEREQMMFEQAEANIRRYNQRLTANSTNEAIVIAGVKPIKRR